MKSELSWGSRGLSMINFCLDLERKLKSRYLQFQFNQGRTAFLVFGILIQFGQWLSLFFYIDFYCGMLEKYFEVKGRGLQKLWKLPVVAWVFCISVGVVRPSGK